MKFETISLETRRKIAEISRDKLMENIESLPKETWSSLYLIHPYIYSYWYEIYFIYNPFVNDAKLNISEQQGTLFRERQKVIESVPNDVVYAVTDIIRYNPVYRRYFDYVDDWIQKHITDEILKGTIEEYLDCTEEMTFLDYVCAYSFSNGHCFYTIDKFIENKLSE